MNLQLQPYIKSLLRECCLLKPLYTFGTEKIHKSSQIYKLQGLQKVMVKDFSSNIIPWMKCFTFWENIKHMSWDGKRAETRVGFPRYFLPTPMTDWA